MSMFTMPATFQFECLPLRHVHLLGIGGAGLNPIARVLLEMGVRVSGSDRQTSAATTELASLGATIYAGQRAENLLDLPADQRPDLVLISSAVDASNPERRAAEQLGIAVVKRSDFLPTLLAGRFVIAVSGTHGKSTTTAMIVKVLREAGIGTGYIVGANIPGLGSASAGTAAPFVIEADEYDRMFHGLTPAIAVVTNVEWDHPDCYPTPESFAEAFRGFIERVPVDGLVVSCADDTGAEAVGHFAQERGLHWQRYGLAEGATVRASDLQTIAGSGYQAEIELLPSFREGAVPSRKVVTLSLRVPGLHNVRNALAALTVALHCGVDPAQAAASLSSYGGVGRRFEIKGEVSGVTVIDDYAHHPTEIRATLAAARGRYPARRIWAVFQPHTFSRTHTLLHEMATSFDHADQVIVSDIYAARESNDGVTSAEKVVKASPHPAICHIAKLEQITDHLAQQVQAGDVVITLGAGDGYKVGEWLLERLHAC